MRVARKSHSELSNDQLQALAEVEDMKPGFQTAIRAALEEFVENTPPAGSQSGVFLCARDLLQALRSRG